MTVKGLREDIGDGTPIIPDNPRFIPVTGVTLNMTSADLAVGSSLQLTASVSAAGKVTGLSAGAAAITVATGSGGGDPRRQRYEAKYPNKAVILLPDGDAIGEAEGDTVIVDGGGNDRIEFSHGGNVLVYNRAAATTRSSSWTRTRETETSVISARVSGKRICSSLGKTTT
jgi:hypothetical protein